MAIFYWIVGAVVVFNALLLASVVVPPFVRNLQGYRKLRGGRWEKRGYWHRYSHCEAHIDERRAYLGIAEDVEDWV